MLSRFDHQAKNHAVWTKSQGAKDETRNPKSEAPKSEGNPKSEIRNRHRVPHSVGSMCDAEAPVALRIECRANARKFCGLGLRISDFGFPSDFGLRISDLPAGFAPRRAPAHRLRKQSKKSRKRITWSSTKPMIIGSSRKRDFQIWGAWRRLQRAVISTLS